MSPLYSRSCPALRVALLASLCSADAWSARRALAVQHHGAQRLRAGASLCRVRLRLSGGSEQHFGTRAMAASLAGASRADAWLRERGVEFSIVEQEQATAKCRDSAAERGVSLRQIIKSMIYARSVPADSQGEDHLEYLHCMLPGHLHVDETKLQALAGGPCRLIESDELIRVTGAVVGAVHPFVPGVSKRLLDKRVQSIAAGGGQVSFNTGDMRVGVLVGYSDLMLALEGQAVVVDLAIAEPGEEYEELAQELSVSVSSARFLMETSFTEPYYRECLSHVASHQRSELAEGLVEWLRSLVRFASQADADAQGVSPLWLVRLACKTDATKYAREEALKAYLASGQVLDLKNFFFRFFYATKYAMEEALKAYLASHRRLRYPKQSSQQTRHF